MYLSGRQEPDEEAPAEPDAPDEPAVGSEPATDAPA
jgi:hypothetical protein